MPNQNIVLIAGHLGKAPDTSKKPIRLSIAETVGYKEKARTRWHDVTVWDDIPECEKGDIAYVMGHIDYSTKDEKKYTNIVADTITIKKKKAKKDDDFVTEE